MELRSTVLRDGPSPNLSTSAWLATTYGWSQAPVTVVKSIRGGARGLRGLDLMLIVTALAGFITAQAAGWLTALTEHLPGGAWTLTLMVTVALVMTIVLTTRAATTVRGRVGPTEVVGALIPVAFCQLLGVGNLLTPLLPSVLVDVIPAACLADASVAATALWILSRHD
jgi:hypothetical protein